MALTSIVLVVPILAEAQGIGVGVKGLDAFRLV